MGEIKYPHDYDDPYKLLATSLIADNDGLVIRSILHDDDFVRRMIIKETRQQDLTGSYTDCIVQTILDDKRRMVLMRELDQLSNFLFENLDLERLRKEIRNFCETCWD